MNESNPAEIRILVVDDDPDVLTGTVRLLKKAGYAVDQAASGEEALQVIRHDCPDLILLDRNLTGIDGVEVCRRIKQDPTLVDVPVVMVSASHAETDEQAEGLESGADGYISRPIANRELLARVGSYVRIRCLTRTLRLQAEALEQRAKATIQAQDASLNLMEDVVEARDRLAVRNQELLREIAEREQTEEKVREQAALLDTANDAIYVTTLDYTVLYWNQGAERIYGWASTEALNRKTTELINPDAAAAEALAAVVLKQGSWAGERRQNTKSGGVVDVFSRLTLVRDKQGQPRSVFAINTDITEKKQLDARFLQAQRLESLGALASGIAHDLNNVLSPILMASAILRDKAQTDSERNMLTTMEACAQRGAGIIRQVLTFARGVEGKRIPLQPRHLLSEIAAIAGETFPKNIELEMDVEKELWPVLGDATQLHQVLMNLCVNARDAMPEGGRLGLNAENIDLDETFALMTPGAKSGPYVHLSIFDTGTGIPPELFNKIFDPFFTTKAPGKGTGLGLSTVLGIVRSHDGFIQFKSEAGKGTCFEVYLPAALDVKPVAVPDLRLPPPRGQGELILVVDDEIAIRKVASKILEVFGYRVVSAADGAEGLAVFMQNRAAIAAIVTDMLMPGMDGPTFVRVVRRIEPKIRIIGISGVDEATAAADLESLGLSALITKPFTGASLAFALHAVLMAPPGTKVTHSASPWRGVSATPWGARPGAVSSAVGNCRAGSLTPPLEAERQPQTGATSEPKVSNAD